MRRLATVLGALVLGMGAPLVSTGPATADSSTPASGPGTTAPSITSLHVVIGPPRAPGPSKRTEPVVVLLRCGATGNEHPYPVEACAEVEAVNGDIDAIPSGGAGCADVWQPVKISVSGVVAGESMQWSDEVSNEGCALHSHGHVFLLPLRAPTPSSTG